MKLKAFVKTYFGITKPELDYLDAKLKDQIISLHQHYLDFENDVRLTKSYLELGDYYKYRHFIERDNRLSNFCKSRGIRYMSDEFSESYPVRRSTNVGRLCFCFSIHFIVSV